MTNYNYFEAVKADVEQWIEDNMDLEHDIECGQFEDMDDIENYLNDTLWIEDSVTGNASGSYTFNRAEARENVLADIEAVVEACKEFEVDGMEKIAAEEWEYLDVTTRCYYLGQAIAEVLDDIKDDIEDAIAARDAENIA